jgi:transposase InsO family protein
MLGDRRYCYPLTITDFSSRYLLTCEALATTREQFAFTVFERTFKEFGVPHANRTDNGVPFASAQALYGLSKLSVWWLRLGIAIERSKPGHPQDNGRHERMHLTLNRQPGGHLIWLDIVHPMYRKADLRLCGEIDITEAARRLRSRIALLSN